MRKIESLAMDLFMFVTSDDKAEFKKRTGLSVEKYWLMIPDWERDNYTLAAKEYYSGKTE